MCACVWAQIQLRTEEIDSALCWSEQSVIFSKKKSAVPSADGANSRAWTHTHTHTVYKPQCRFGGVSSSENASRRSDGWCVFEPCTLVTYNTAQSSWPPEGIRRLRNWHLDCANFNTLLSNSPSCAGLIVRAMLLWPCGVIGAVIEFDSCYSGSASSYCHPGQLRRGGGNGNLSFLYRSVCRGDEIRAPSCPLSPSCWCLKLIGGVGSFTRLGSLWVWSKEQLELASGRSVCDAAPGGCQWENLSVVKTSALIFISSSVVFRVNCLFTRNL